MKVRAWDNGEIGKLMRMYSDGDFEMEDIMRQLPGRTETAIRLKASRLHLRRRTLDYPKISELNWVTHGKGDKLLIISRNLSLIEAVRAVLGSDGEIEATGWEESIPQVTIKKA